MQISNDSTCDSIENSNYLMSNQKMLTIPNSKNKQVYKMRLSKEMYHQQEVVDNANSDFPDWLQGNWQHLSFKKNQLVYRDHTSFKLFTMSLISQYKLDKFIVLSRTQCGEEHFKCLWIKQLDQNIIDFQIGSHTTTNLTNYSLCDDEYFKDNRWLTQGSEYSNLKSRN